ncbi:putative basic proline-rich protein-like isoform X1 [Iris pallida]|uniref:Basic proline-rich protein-like isoform X1 n=1 Tax=Iris pallida TaxID=29817 RepID=A0AAX6F107_IRIPA|nr:putative basic proline-rich protein-like isoform X1 [Iris pallida]
MDTQNTHSQEVFKEGRGRERMISFFPKSFPLSRVRMDGSSRKLNGDVRSPREAPQSGGATEEGHPPKDGR